MVFCTIASLSTQTHRWRGSFDIVDVTGKGGGGFLPQKIFGLNGFKSCNSRQKKKMPLKVRVGKLDPFHDLDKGNLEKE